MATVTRRELRETVFALLFETDFHRDEQPADIYNLAQENREFCEDEYIRSTYFGAVEKCAALDVMIGRHSKDWKITRLAHVSRAVLRYCAYELMYTDIPVQIALNEAVVLDKKFDAPEARKFVNGVLNAIKNEIEQLGKQECIRICEEALQDEQPDEVPADESGDEPGDEPSAQDEQV